MSDLPEFEVHPTDVPIEEADLVMIHDTPMQLWFEGVHYVETENRRAEPGKIYYYPGAARMLFRVTDITPAEELDDSADPTDFDIEDPVDEIEAESLYDLAPDSGPYPVGEDHREHLPRYHFEVDEALDMGGSVYVAFEECLDKEFLERRTTIKNLQESHATLDEFRPDT